MSPELVLSSTAQFRVGGPKFQSIELAIGGGGERAVAVFEDARIVGVLLELRRRATRSAAIELASVKLDIDRSSAGALIDEMRQRGVLVDADAPDPYRGEAAGKWIKWGWRDALDFHLAIRDLPFSPGDAEGYSEQNAYLSGLIDAGERGDDEPSPPPYKDYPGAERVELARGNRAIDDADIARALYKRRTCRKFRGRALDGARFAELCEHAFARTRELDFGAMGPHIARTTPSGGARHPVEVYPVIFDVDGFEPGLYHYSVRDHALETLRAGDFSREVFELGHQQTGIENVSAAFIYTARWDRHVWKYRYARSYRMVLFDVAHLVQTTLFCATALGFLSFLTPALRDTDTAAFLGIDDELAESPLYLTTIG